MPFSNCRVLKSCSSESIASAAVRQTRSSTSPPRAALSRFASRSVISVSTHYRKRCSTRLVQSTHTARPSRRLLSPAQPGSRRAGHAVCLRLWWLGRFRNPIARRQRQFTLFRSFQWQASRHGDGFGLSSSPMRSLTASFSDSSVRAFTSQPSLFRSRGRASVLKRMTPNHALQRTAPRVTVAAISSSNPSRASVALSYVRCRHLRSTTQLPRRAPQSLSLGSLAVTACLL